MLDIKLLKPFAIKIWVYIRVSLCMRNIWRLFQSNYRAVNIQNDLWISVDLHLDEFMYKYVMFAGSGSSAGNGNNFEWQMQTQ